MLGMVGKSMRVGAGYVVEIASCVYIRNNITRTL